jgi:hypothetical protein
MKAELDMMVAMWNSVRAASLPIDGKVVSITLCPTEVASSAQNKMRKTMGVVEAGNTL